MTKSEGILRNLLVMAFLWMVTSFSQYMLVFQMKYLNGSFFSNQISASISELFAYIIQPFAYQFLGYKTSSSIFYSVTLAGAIGILTL